MKTLNNITCARCGRKWHTKSTAYRTKCAHCGYCTPNPNFNTWKQITDMKWRNKDGYEIYIEDQIENEYETGKYELNIWLADGGYWETINVYNTLEQAIAAMETWIKNNPKF